MEDGWTRTPSRGGRHESELQFSTRATLSERGGEWCRFLCIMFYGTPVFRKAFAKRSFDLALLDADNEQVLYRLPEFSFCKVRLHVIEYARLDDGLLMIFWID